MTKDELKILKADRREKHLCTHCGRQLLETNSRETCDSCHKVGKLANSPGGWRWKLFREILDNYGYKCACCGETEPMFLTVDHRFGTGNKHRREVRRTSNEWYKAVIEEGFPDCYQILCFNCNLGRERNKGVCPHMEIE